MDLFKSWRTRVRPTYWEPSRRRNGVTETELELGNVQAILYIPRVLGKKEQYKTVQGPGGKSAYTGTYRTTNHADTDTTPAPQDTHHSPKLGIVQHTENPSRPFVVVYRVPRRANGRREHHGTVHPSPGRERATGAGTYQTRAWNSRFIRFVVLTKAPECYRGQEGGPLRYCTYLAVDSSSLTSGYLTRENSLAGPSVSVYFP